MQSPIFSDFFLHLDMDAFFAAIEQRDNPSLKGLPVIVSGSSPTRAVVSTCSYEARVYGVRSAMSVAKAKELCPDVITIVGKMSHYKEISRHLMAILSQYSTQVEPLSIDEAFLRISNDSSVDEALDLAKQIKDTVWQNLSLTCSIGIAENKFLAKLASSHAKPSGLLLIEPHKAKDFIASLKLSDLYGVGYTLESKLVKNGIKTTRQLQEASLIFLQQVVGLRQAWHLFQLAQGLDIRGKEPREPQNRSIGHETTFDWDVEDEEILLTTLMMLVYRVWYRLLSREEFSRTLKIKLKYADFKEVQQQLTVGQELLSAGECYRHAQRLLRKCKKRSYGIRLLGVTLVGLHKKTTRNLFRDLYEEREAIVEQIAYSLDQRNITLVKARICQWK